MCGSDRNTAIVSSGLVFFAQIIRNSDGPPEKDGINHPTRHNCRNLEDKFLSDRIDGLNAAPT
ncbi:MAG: hypothetical protein DME98_14310 [Verrucomicrobia bacterium]|nr:MAG: hypothetical protein DME98_14310 [Verrucomicrobiota bacterium]PYJ31432.1 MAG: hypothetical protein DME88_15045 [Verrucomicrobiota bacterium]